MPGLPVSPEETGLLRPCGRLSCHRPFCLSFKTVSLFALSAHLPDYTLGAELTVSTGVGAGLAVFKAFLAIADCHLLALDNGLTARVISAFHDFYSSFVICLIVKFIRFNWQIIQLDRHSYLVNTDFCCLSTIIKHQSLWSIWI
jgi:hypothetical protein